MTLSIVNEIWNEVKSYISTVDREEVAETVINILIDNDIDAEEIKSAFKNDSDIKRALAQYLHDIEEDEEDEEDEDDYNELY